MGNNILYIEDNDQNFYLVKFMLSAKGMNVIRARDGIEGIEAVKTMKPDLVLLDIELPSMNGYEVAAELRKNGEPGNIPIIAVTSYAMAGDREKAMAAGCTGYIEKPINPDTFTGEVMSYLDRGKNDEDHGGG